MVLPLYDENPFKQSRAPWATWVLISANIPSLLYVMGSPAELISSFVSAFALIPASLKPECGSAFTPLSYMFVHTQWAHLLGNMLLLLVFGSGVEAKLGAFRFLAIYLMSGVFGGLAFVLANPASPNHLIGASGAVAGVMSVYLMIRPCALIVVSAGGALARVRAYWIIGGWLLVQVFYYATSGQHHEIAYITHLGGALAGAALLLVIRPADVALFQCEDTNKDQVFSALVSSIPVVGALLSLAALLLLTR